jgi:hypothetical protein
MKHQIQYMTWIKELLLYVLIPSLLSLARGKRMKGLFPFSSSVHHMVPCIRVLYPQWPAHKIQLSYHRITVNISRLDPYHV